METQRRIRSPKGTRKPYCSSCGKLKDGAHKTYCKACYNARRNSTPEAREAWNKYYRDRWANMDPDVKKARSKNFKLKYAYGMTLDDFNSMVAEQDGKCAICRGEFDLVNNPRAVHVDHCHETKVVRGILCHGCNTSLGHFKHNTDLLNAAIRYLASMED